MRLDEDQLEAFERDGFLVLPGLFSAPEVAALRARLPALYAEDTPPNVRERQGGEVPYVVGEAYTIADMAIFPWVRRPENQGVEASEYPNYLRWREAIAARPAVQRGVEVLADRRRDGPMSKKAREVMFGAAQYQRR